MDYKMKRKIVNCLENNEKIIKTMEYSYYNGRNYLICTNKGKLIYYHDSDYRYFIVQKLFLGFLDDDNLSDDEFITQIGAGKFYFVALTNKQKVYTWRFDRIQNKMTPPTQKLILDDKGESQLITQINVGFGHTLVQTTKGEIYGWGSNYDGQCGTGQLNYSPIAPRKIKFSGLSKNDSIIQISISNNFNVVLTSHGKLFTWGNNQFGKGNGWKILIPTEIPSFHDNKVEKLVLIDTMVYQSIAFTNLGTCFEWGNLRRNSHFESMPIKSLHPLHSALSYKQTTLARQLMTPNNINELNEFDESPLFIACMKGLEDIVKEILQKMKPIHQEFEDIDDESTKNPVDAASANGYLSIVKLLLENGLKGSKISLFRAIHRGYTDIIKVLLQYQVDLLDTRTFQGFTPLYLACQSGNIDLVKLFLSKGIDDQSNEDGNTPLILSYRYPSLYVKEIPLDCQENSYYVDAEPTLEDSPFKETNFLIASLLLKHNANVHLQNNEGLTAAMIATRHCQYSFLNLLLTYEPQLVHTYTEDCVSLLHLLLYWIK